MQSIHRLLLFQILTTHVYYFLKLHIVYVVKFLLELEYGCYQYVVLLLFMNESVEFVINEISLFWYSLLIQNNSN